MVGVVERRVIDMTKCEMIKCISQMYLEQDYRYAELTHDEMMRMRKRDLELYLLKIKRYGND